MMTIGWIHPFYVILICRPSGSAVSFLVYFGDFLLSSIKLERIILLGSLNFHVDYSLCSIASDFHNLLESFHFIQHVTQ